MTIEITLRPRWPMEPGMYLCKRPEDHVKIAHVVQDFDGRLWFTSGGSVFPLASVEKEALWSEQIETKDGK